MLWCNTRNVSTAFLASLFLVSAQAVAQDGPKLDVVYVSTPPAVVNRMLEMAKVGKDDFVIDLGSGDGRILVAAASKFGARGFGVDIDPERVAEARANAEQAGVGDRIEFRQQNLFETDISKADVLTMYLLSRINRELRPRILSQLRPGARVVSHAFDMAEWKADRHEKVEGRDVYLWIVPAPVEGRWSVQAGSDKFTLDLKQQFQNLQGSAEINGRQVPVQEARLRGEEISFKVDVGGSTREFQGRVEGDRIQARSEGGQASWMAQRQSSVQAR
jgi:protein-L-isoaspartate O-methyltransferase